MRNIYTIVETVLDILFRNHEPFTAKAGGACLNTAVTLGRLGHNVQLISEYGLDEVGNYIEHFLNDNNVLTDYVYRYIDGKSALALAFLNENNDASYDFYKIYPEDRLNTKFPEIKQDDIVLFGSFYAITVEVRRKLLEFIKAAKKNKAIVIYDPNFRKPHLHDLKWLKPMIEENIGLARIVRGSNEDFTLIFGTGNSKETYEILHEKTPVLLYTANTKGVFLHTPKLEKQFPVKKINPISTIGAGDNFNAGIIYSLMEYNIKYKDLPHMKEEEWKKIVENGVEFASQVCMSYDNYISAETVKSFKTIKN